MKESERASVVLFANRILRLPFSKWLNALAASDTRFRIKEFIRVECVRVSVAFKLSVQRVMPSPILRRGPAARSESEKFLSFAH